MPNNSRPLYLNISGQYLLGTSLLNKGSAFSIQEKKDFNIEGLIPHNVETIEQQTERVYQQFSYIEHELDKHIYLRNIQDTNETLYLRLISDHLEEMLPIIYTPTVGKACQLFSQIYRRKRGIFISYLEKEHIRDVLHNATKPNVKVIVITDSERILGLGDQGIGGMGIPIGKLSIYSACGGISPAYTLPITLDVGTNNQELLDDPMYMGWRHERIRGEEYFKFVEQCLEGIHSRWPNALIQFEDFAQANATPLLKQYKDKYLCFNDDIQGTASVTVGTLLAACHAQKSQLKDHKVVFVGAGSAGCGIAEQIVAHMMEEGLTSEEAISQVYLTNSKGLLTEKMSLQPFQEKFAKQYQQVSSWSETSDEKISLLDVVKTAKPSIIIGVSGQPGLISEEIVRLMADSTEQPIIMPLSNPTSRVEALPEDVLKWTDGRAIVATGSPFDPIEYNGKTHTIAQCNNAYIFPGIGLGVVAIKAKRVTDQMFMVASKALAACSPLVTGEGSDLLPSLSDIHQVSIDIAFAVAKQAIEEGVAVQISENEIRNKIDRNFWQPEYRDYRRTSL